MPVEPWEQHRPSEGARRALVVLLSLSVLVGAALVWTTRSAPADAPAPLRAGPRAHLAAPPAAHPVSRAEGVRALLARRAAAVLHHDRPAFLATVDRHSPAFRARQGRLFDALAGVRFASWSYEVDDSPRRLPAGARRGNAAWSPWLVSLHYRLAGFETRATSIDQHLTFLRRDGRWLLASDSDFDAAGPRTSREIWDFGPVVAVRGTRSLVLAHPGQREIEESLAAEADRDVPRVTEVWGRGWARTVVIVVPNSIAELGRLLDRSVGSLQQIAAVATAKVGGDAPPVGDRVLVNPGAVESLGSLGRRVVLTHEITHVATRSSTGTGAPSWLVEGFADYVGYRGTAVDVRSAADELARDVRAGRVPDALPTDSDFAGESPVLAQSYEESWLACRLIVDRLGQDALVRFYRAVAPATGGGSDAPVAAGMRSVLGTTTARFTASWRDYLRSRLS